jgi:hypothetical protein
MDINLPIFWRNALPPSSAYETGGEKKHLIDGVCSSRTLIISTKLHVITPQIAVIFWIKEIQFQGGTGILSNSIVK